MSETARPGREALGPGSPIRERPRTASVGHGSRSREEMAALLKARGITCVADVRRFPSSRRHPHFAAAALRRWLGEDGIAYVELGETLGGFRTGGYEAWTRTPTFAQGLVRLEELARQALAEGGLVAFMCSERLPWRCHRRFIGRELQRRGWDVVHVIDARRDWRPREQADLFDEAPIPPAPRSG